MPKDYSPFSPGQPVPAEFFVGRIPEIERLQGSAEAAASGRLQVAFLDGERGIGKSSLASTVRSVAERELNVIAPDPDGGRGAYRFDNRLHYLYIWIETQRTTQRRRRQGTRPTQEQHP